MDAASQPEGDDWLALVPGPLPVAEASSWAVLPSCGATVLFTGTSRDHSRAGGQERRGVTVLEYEAFDDQVVPRLACVAAEIRRRWADTGRVVLLHRTGTVPVGEASVVVVVSAPHRDAAFAAARFGIDAVKATVPLWKKEVWPGGSAWGLDAAPVREIEEFGEIEQMGERPR